MKKYKLIYIIFKSSYFVIFAEFAAWENERGRVNIQIFEIQNMHGYLTHQAFRSRECIILKT